MWGLIPARSLILLDRAAMFGVVIISEPSGFSTLLISCSRQSVSKTCSITSPKKTTSKLLFLKGSFSSVSCSMQVIPLFLHNSTASLEISTPVTSLQRFFIFSVMWPSQHPMSRTFLFLPISSRDSLILSFVAQSVTVSSVLLL